MFRCPSFPTWCVLMEWRSATVQSTSGSGEPEPLQVMTAFSPSRTVRFTWLTLISGRSRRADTEVLRCGAVFAAASCRTCTCGPKSCQAACQLSPQHLAISSRRQWHGILLPREGGSRETGNIGNSEETPAEQTLPSDSNPKVVPSSGCPSPHTTALPVSFSSTEADFKGNHF